MTSSEQPRTATKTEILDWVAAEDLASTLRESIPHQAEAEVAVSTVVDGRRVTVATAIRDTLLVRKAENSQERERLAEEARTIKKLLSPSKPEVSNETVDLTKGVISQEELLAYVRSKGVADTLSGRAWYGMSRQKDELDLFDEVDLAEEGVRPQITRLLNIEKLETLLLTSPDSLRSSEGVGDKTVSVLEDLVIDYRMVTPLSEVQPVPETAGI